jgi:hypothetical protein
MQIKRLLVVGTNYSYRWSASTEVFIHWVAYCTKVTDGKERSPTGPTADHTNARPRRRRS